MTNKEAIDAINKECEKTMLLLTCSSEFAHALERSINALEKMDDKEIELEELKRQIRAEAIDEFFNALKEYSITANDCVTEIVDVMDIIKVKNRLKEQK